MQCRRQSNQNEGALAESGERGGGALKNTEIFHIKTDILRPQIMLYVKNFVFISETRVVYIRPVSFLRSFRIRPMLSPEKSACNSKCDQKRY